MTHGSVDDFARRARLGELEGLGRQVRRTAGCSNPVRLRGRQDRIARETGEILETIITAREPGGVLLVACGDRRAAACPSCARAYRGDAFHLVAAGLRGGKGTSEAVAGHPAVIVTLTAPSFGRVHTIRDRDGLCACHRRHAPEDPVIGTPIDPDTYRYTDQVVWNHLAPRLWKRTAQAIRRGLARELGVPRGKLEERARVRFVKASEFQRRGVVHFHVVIRVDGPGDPASTPPAVITSRLLERIVVDAVRSTSLRVPSRPGRQAAAIRWGRQLEVARLERGTVSKAAGYIAKYATKATETATGGVLIPRVRSHRHVVELDVPDHAKRLVESAWHLGAIDGLEGACRWAHQFGYGGHTLTKSPDYSVTFGVLREARSAWRDGQESTSMPVEKLGRLTFAGRGYTDPGETLLAALNRSAMARGDT
ncbi:MAG: replication initiator [Gaiellaceae bacterium]